jgi:peptide/nickel transport system ATP-binding protein
LSKRSDARPSVVGALDVSVRAQILNYWRTRGPATTRPLVLVSRDPSVVRHQCDRVLVMRAGEVVEAGETRALFREPRHRYTRELLSAIPRPRNRRAASA